MEMADAGLDKQRLGVEDNGSGAGSSSVEDLDPLTGPRGGPATVGVPWDADTSQEISEVEKG